MRWTRSDRRARRSRGNAAVVAMHFTGTMPIPGFAWAMIYDGKNNENDRNIYVQLDFDKDWDLGGDTVDSGYGNVTGLGRPTLVNP